MQGGEGLLPLFACRLIWRALSFPLPIILYLLKDSKIIRAKGMRLFEKSLGKFWGNYQSMVVSSNFCIVKCSFYVGIFNTLALDTCIDMCKSFVG